MLGQLGHLVFRRRRLVLGLAALFAVFAIVWGTGVFGSLVSGGFTDPGSDSSKEQTVADRAFGQSAPDAVVVYSSPRLTVDDPAFAGGVQRMLASLPPDRVVHAVSYWSTDHAAGFVSADRHSTYVALQIRGSYSAIAARLGVPGLTMLRGGPVVVNDAINTRVKSDIGRAEGLSFPILLVLLILVFGGLAAASLPLAVGGFAILGAFTTLRVVSFFTGVSIYAVNIVTMLGLGLAIDYGLFMVSRFREELAFRGGRRDATEDALVATMQTAGRTVLFSGLTVAVALSSLMLFSLPFLRSMGYGGVAAVLVAMVGGLTLLPALLAVLGPRVNSLRVRMPWRGHAVRATRSSDAPAPDDLAGARARERGAWYRIATSVMRRPVLYVIGTTTVLLLMGVPFLRVHWSSPDQRTLPAGTESRVAADVLKAEFPAANTNPIDIYVSGAAATTTGLHVLTTGYQAVAGITGARVVAIGPNDARIQLSYSADSSSTAGRALVATLRQIPVPADSRVLVGGFTAANADTLSAIGRTLPWAGAWIVVGMFVLLFFAFGSVVLPIKAILMNFLSLSAAFGAVVWIFQEGHLSGPLGFTALGGVDATQPVLMFAIAFGLAMDYEVFLLSRIREEWDRTGDNTAAVALGLERTGRIITSAALLLVVVIGAFATSGVTFIKMIGVGVAIAVLVDATIVRALLVPATMRLLGRYNWWAPAPLRRVYGRFGLSESGSVGVIPVPEPGAKVSASA